MSAIIVDASVGVKWFVPEVHAAEARAWRHGPDALHIPAFFFDLEIAISSGRRYGGRRSYARMRT